MWHGAEIDCNLNQMAQKIPLVNLSTRKIIFENNEHVILPSGLSPPAQVHRGGKPGAPCHLPLREPPFPGSGMLLLPPRAVGGHPGPNSPVAARHKLDRGELSGPLEAGAGGVEKKGSLEERAQGLWYLYKKHFQFWFPSGITCKALKNTPVPRFYPGTNKNFCGQDCGTK